jgi:hypothetical protein
VWAVRGQARRRAVMSRGQVRLATVGDAMAPRDELVGVAGREAASTGCPQAVGWETGARALKVVL